MTPPTLILARDGMGLQATEADFDSWVALVCERIDAACGFEVEVEVRRRGDVQDNKILGAEFDARAETIHRAIERIWDEWCSGAAESARP